MNASKQIMTWADGHGKEVVREVNQTVHLGDFRDTPGYAMLLVAANTHLSVSDIARWFRLEGVGRSRSWIARRRWMFQQPGTDNGNGPRPNADGKDARAIAIMRECPTLSVRKLSRVLADMGIRRSSEWVRQRRCG